MKRVLDKVIEERIELHKCLPGDKISLGYQDDVGHRLPGTIVLVKIKRIPNGKVQIKYRGVYFSTVKVHKIDLRADIRVTRHRKATGEDIHPVKPAQEMTLTEVLAAGLSHPISREVMQSRLSFLPTVRARQSEELVSRVLESARMLESTDTFPSIIIDSISHGTSNPPISISNLEESLKNLPKHRPGDIIALPGSGLKKLVSDAKKDK